MFDSSGTFGTVRSKGWEGERLELEGEATSALRVRETITRVGPDELHATWEALLDGTWTAYSVERLRRER